MIIPTIATLEQLRAHLRLPPAVGSPPVGPDDADLQLKLDAATQQIIDAIMDRQPADPVWIAEIESWTLAGSPTTLPPAVIVMAVLEQAAYLYRYRGDDADDPLKQPGGWLIPAVQNLITRYQNRAFA